MFRGDEIALDMFHDRSSIAAQACGRTGRHRNLLICKDFT
jgi:hypothetical protein